MGRTPVSNENLIRQWRAARRDHRRASIAVEVNAALAKMQALEARMTPKQREQILGERS